MSDYNSSLPVRTENAGDVIAKISDATVPSQQLTVEADGSINVNAVFSPGTEVIITDGTDDLAINGDGSLNAVVTATNLDIRDLVFATDKVDASGSTLGANSGVDIGDVTINNAAGAAAVNIQDGGNSITVDGSVTVSATDLDIRDLAFATDKVDASGSVVALDAPTLAALESITVQNGAAGAAVNIQDGGNSITVDGSVTVSATDLDIRDLAFATDSVDVSGSEVSLDATTLAALENITVSATDLDIRDLTHVSDSVKIGDGTDFLAVNTDGSINVVVSGEQDGTEVINYNTSASVGSAASVNHDYTVPGGVTFYGEEAWMSASSKMKAQLLINGAVKWVGFNSTANPNIRIPLEHLAKASAAQVVRITLTNLDNQSQDLYSTLLGVTRA